MAEPGINYTLNFNLAKPEQGYKNWGTPLNENADKIDAALKNIRTPGNIGDIKYSVLTEAPPGGAWCDGAEYTQAMFPDIYQMLVDGKISSTDFTTFDESVSTNGSCGLFGLDTDTTSFKVPLLKDVYIKASDAPLAFGAESLSNITGQLWHAAGYSGGTSSGAFGTYQQVTGGPAGTNSNNSGYTSFDASRSSPAYQDGAKVNPDNVVYRAYVVLYASAAEVSEAQAGEFMTALGSKANADLTNVSITGKETAVAWIMPDYTAGVDLGAVPLAASPFTAPDAGIFVGCWTQEKQSSCFAYINGIKSGFSSTSPDIYRNGEQYFIPLSKGDKLYFDMGSDFFISSYFYPLKGVNNA